MRTDDLPNWVPKGAVLQHHIFFTRHTHRSRPGPDLVPTSVQTQPNQPKWSRLPEKLKFQPCLHYTRDTLWPVAAHELRSTMGATEDANMNWQERVAVFDLKAVTVDSDQRATLADAVRIFADAEGMT